MGVLDFQLQTLFSLAVQPRDYVNSYPGVTTDETDR